MQIIGITGAIGHGKTSLAEAFMRAEPKSIHLESGLLIAEVADALHKKLSDIPDDNDLPALNDWLGHLPHILAKVLHLDTKFSPVTLDSETIRANPAEYEKLFLHLHNLRQNPQLRKQEITIANKASYRPFLQWIGGFVTLHLDARAWLQALVRRAQKSAEDDGTTLALIGGLRLPNDGSVVHEAGGTVIKIERPGAPQPDMNDPTERERESIRTDVTVFNDGSLEDLAACAQKILQDLRAGQLQPSYRAKL